MNLIGPMEAVSLALLGGAAALLLRPAARQALRPVGVLPFFLLGLCGFQALSNTLEWSGVTPALDQFEDYSAVLLPALWFFMFYAWAQEAAGRRLRKTEEDLAITLASIGEAVVAADEGGAVTWMNAVAEQLTGFRAAEASGRPLEQVVPLVEPASGALGHLVLRSRDGRERPVVRTVAPILDRASQGRGSVLVLRDVSEPLRMEEQLRQAHKMEAVGRLAGGIAHDFNNSLTGILGFADLLRLGAPAGSPERGYAETVVRTARRAAELIAKLLAFSRKAPTVRVVFDAARVVEEVAAIAERTVGPRIRLTRRFEAPVAPVMGDPAQIETSLMNLAVNARDALSAGGELTFATALVDLAAGAWARPPCEVAAGRYLEVAVSDTGSGMAPEVLERLFEPFFTTKPVGQGTGMGLAAVYGIVRDHGGGIRVDSEPGLGSTFRLYLPLHGRSEGGTAAEGSAGAVRGCGRILVVDDEEVVRCVARKMLEALGYEVLEAEDGQAAVDLVAAGGTHLDLVVLDLAMPRMGGREALRRLLELRPGLRVVISSAFGLEDGASDLVAEGAVGLLPKPYRIEALSAVVAESLVRPAGGASRPS